EYYVSKITAALICFLVPWSVCAIATVAGILMLESIPDGVLAYVTVMLLYFVRNFCLFLSIVISTMSEKFTVAAIILTNIGIALALQLFARVAVLGDYLEVDQIVWSPAVSIIVLVELLFCVLSLWTALSIRKRNKDLV